MLAKRLELGSVYCRISAWSTTFCHRSLVQRVYRKLTNGAVYADDLVIMAATEELLVEKFQKWNKSMGKKGLRVNLGRTKVMKWHISITSIYNSLMNTNVVYFHTHKFQKPANIKHIKNGK